MKRLVIIGAGGFGREVANAVPECRGFGRDFVLKGFLDANLAAMGGFAGYPPILGTPESYEIEPDDVFFAALGNPKTRCRVVGQVASRGGRFLTLIHGTATLGRNVEVGEGCYIAHHAVLTADIRLGRHVCVFHGTVIGHDGRIGDWSHVSSLVFFGGGVRLGEGVTVHPGVRIAPFKTVGDGATIGIGSVVLSNVRAGQTVFGVPAQDVLA